MRMRKKPWAEEEIAGNAHVISDAEAAAGKWSAIFGNENPLHVEIGTGTGGFIAEMAANEPGVNFIGIERQLSVFAAAAKKVRLTPGGLPNVRLVYCDAGMINKIFIENEVSHIYINFCDPWPKKKNEKRRLTHSGFLKLYSDILKEGGKMELRTDSKELFRFSADELVKCGWGIEKSIERDGEETRVTTEYERKFSSLGKKTYEIAAFIAPKEESKC